MGVDPGEDGLREIVPLEQTVELQQRRGVGRSFTHKIDVDEAAYGLAVVERILQAFVGQSQALHVRRTCAACAPAPPQGNSTKARSAAADLAGVIRLLGNAKNFAKRRLVDSLKAFKNYGNESFDFVG